MKKNIFKFGNRFFVSILVLMMAFTTAAVLIPSRLAWADTPDEQAKKDADKKAAEDAKKAAELQKHIAEMHKKAEESVRYKFDRFKKSTLVATDSEKVRSLSAIFTVFGDLFLGPSANVADEITKDTRPAAPPDTVKLFFWARAEKEDKLNYANAKEVDFLVDGKPLGPYDVKYTYGPDGANFLENMIVEVPYADYRKIVFCKDTTEGRLGEIEFKFNDYQKILFRTFLNRISPAETDK